MENIVVDIAVIGAGSAGLSAYRAAKTHGKKVVLIEGGPYGTTCARVGCMPSKLLIAAANTTYDAANASRFGVYASDIRVDGKEVMQRVRSERDRFVGFVVKGIESIDPQDRLIGYAKFLDNNRLQVGDNLLVTAERIVIATGSSPAIPEIFKAAQDRLIVNDDVFSWDDLPKRVAVFGAGVIGLELGQALSRLGVETALFGVGGFVGPLSDPKVMTAAREIFKSEFDVDFYTNLLYLKKEGKEIVIDVMDNKTQTAVSRRFDYLLLATGRKPNVDKLGLENTTLELDDRGVPVFDKITMQCGDSSIFVAGDVNNYLPLLHEASDEGVIAGNNAALWPDVQPGLRRTSLSVTFSEPEIMMIGSRFIDLEKDTFVVGQVDFSDQGRSRVMLKNKGLLRIYADRENRRLLGAEMIGPAAEHIAHFLAWAHQMRMTIDQMLTMPFYHPVVEEGVRTALRETLKQLDSV